MDGGLALITQLLLAALLTPLLAVAMCFVACYLARGIWVIVFFVNEIGKFGEPHRYTPPR